LNDDYGGVWMLGRVCFWCAGCRVGDFEMPTSLRDVLFQLDQMRRDTGRRENSRFDNVPATVFFRLVYDALFGGTGLSDSAIAEQEQWGRHNILPSVDVFDGWKAFLLENGETGRIVFSAKPYEEIHEALVEVGLVDTVLDEGRHFLWEIYDREAEEGSQT
jgi:hypothetical protein